MMYEYQILETESPTASVEQLNDFGKERWILQIILPWNGKFYYHFVREKILSPKLN